MSKAAKPKKKIQVYTLKADMTCEEARKLFTEGTITDYDQMIELEAKVRQCIAKEHNKAHPEDPVVVTMSVDQSEENPKILFNTIRLNDAKKVAEVTKILIAIGSSVEFAGDPTMISLVYGAASFSVDAYLKAAIKNDPMIIFLPQYVPTKEIGKKVFKTIVDGKIDDKVQIIVEDGIDFLKKNPALLLDAGSKVILDGLKVVAPRVIVATIDKVEKKVVNIVDDGTEFVIEGGKKVVKTAGGVVKDAGGAVAGGVREVGREIKKRLRKPFG